MSKITPVAGIIFVEGLDKLKKRTSHDPFTSLVSSSNLGTVKYSSDVEFPTGTQVYFGNTFEKLLVEGGEVMAMKTDNVLAKVTE